MNIVTNCVSCFRWYSGIVVDVAPHYGDGVYPLVLVVRVFPLVNLFWSSGCCHLTGFVTRFYPSYLIFNVSLRLLHKICEVSSSSSRLWVFPQAFSCTMEICLFKDQATLVLTPNLLLTYRFWHVFTSFSTIVTFVGRHFRILPCHYSISSPWLLLFHRLCCSLAIDKTCAKLVCSSFDMWDVKYIFECTKTSRTPPPHLIGYLAPHNN